MRTLFDKVWDRHVVHSEDGQRDLLYIDLHLVQEVSSPQAFDELRRLERGVRRPHLTLATCDHSVPTLSRDLGLADPLARKQVEVLRRNCADFGVPLYDLDAAGQGIVHVIGPELGLSQPGMTIVCGDSHTSTHGALGALAFGIGTTEVAHVLATQCLWQARPKTLLVELTGTAPAGVTAKDLALALISARGDAAASGHAIEFAGEAVEALSMEARMTLCNMSIEAGARVGMIGPDGRTVEYLRRTRYFADDPGRLREVAEVWRSLRTERDAVFDARWQLDVSECAPMVSWGTTTAMSVPVTGRVPSPEDTPNPERAARALDYMGLHGGEAMEELSIATVFIGSCTNSRIEDLRAAASVARDRRVAPGVRAIVVPGSTAVRRQAEAEGTARTLIDAGFEWRHSGCSMCVAMNGDRLEPGERCASTSNRNFEGRQGARGRTHLMSPAMAAAAAVTGRIADVRTLSET